MASLILTAVYSCVDTRKDRDLFKTKKQPLALVRKLADGSRLVLDRYPVGDKLIAQTRAKQLNQLVQESLTG